MAINYTNLFSCLGELVERVTLFKGWYSTLDSALTETLTDYQTAGLYTLLDNYPDLYDGLKSQVRSMIQTMNNQAVLLLTDRDTILANLTPPDTSLPTVLNALIADMIGNSQTIRASTVTLGGVSATKTNANAGTLVTDKVLDGVTSPGSGFNANRNYLGLNSELSIGDSVTVSCVADSYTDRTTVGGEVFQWTGKPLDQTFGWKSSTSGSGTGPSVSSLLYYTSSYISNYDFETWSTNTPGSWTLTSGTAGTHIFKNSTAPYRGTYNLKMTGDGALANITLDQTPTSSSLVPMKRYCVACYVKGTAATLSGTLTISFVGTGYSPGATEKVSMDATALSAATSWTMKHFFVNLPAQIPSDFKLRIIVSGTLTSGKDVQIDDLQIAPATYWNGICYAVVNGTEVFVRGDKFTFTISNNETGVFQTWARDALAVQLPSSGSPTINDSLASD